MKASKYFLWLFLPVIMVMVASCGNDEPEGVESYYLDIQSQVRLNLDGDDDESQGTMPADARNDVLSKTILKMKTSLEEVTSKKNSRQANDAAVIRVCDSIYNAYATAYGNMERIIVCHVKVYRTKVVNGLTQYNLPLKSYQFWLVDVDPNPPAPTEKIEKPECLAQVDLGLSVMWANCNLGAKMPEGFGGYYAWGDPTGKLWSAAGIGWNNNVYTWNTDNYGGIDPPLNISGSSLDIVAANWGDGWRMPTYSEAKELCEQCQWVLREQNEIKWYEVIGPNGNSIIVPLAGMFGDNVGDPSSRFYAGPFGTKVTGVYWTSTICLTPVSAEVRSYGVASSVKTAWVFVCNSTLGYPDGIKFTDHLRAFHMSIRAVHDKE